MAQKVQVLVTCDLHVDDTEGVETIVFGFDGSDYELDLCAEHSEQVHYQLEELISHARRAGGNRGRRRSTAGRSRADRAAKPGSDERPGTDRDRVKVIREWARSHGHPDLSSRGRIPRAVLEEYEAAHST